MINRFILYILLLLFIFGCKKRKQPIEWDADFSVPIAYGSLSIIDILTDTLTSTNTDQTVNLNYTSQLYQLILDSLVDIPGSDLSDTFALPFPVAVAFNPGQIFINQIEEYHIDLSSIELTEFSLLSATLNYSIKSTIQGEVIYEYQINSATDQQGNIFTHEITVPAAQPGAPSVIDGSLSLSSYDWDLRGISGNKTNTIQTTLNVRISANNVAPITVSNQDTLFVNNQISSIEVLSAEGYFGQESITIGPETIPIEIFDKISAGSVDINQVNVDFSIINGVGVDAQITMNELSVNDPTSGMPLSIGHSILGQPQNINRAYKTGNIINPSNYSTTFNQNNSNIESMLELLPDELNYDLNILINPLGNISGHNDFIHKDYPFSVNLDLLMPLDLIANNLTLQDTLNINLADTTAINYGNLYIEIENGFPFESQIIIGIPGGNIDLLSPNTIYPGVIDLSGMVTESTPSVHIIDLSYEDIQLLKLNKKLILTLIFNTADPGNNLNIYSHYKIDFKISGDFNATIKIP